MGDPTHTTALRDVIEALEPCPWCGQKMERAIVSEGSTFRWRKVDGCCADGPEIRHDTMADDQDAAEVESRRRAIEAWNERDPNIRRALAVMEAVEAAPVVEITACNQIPGYRDFDFGDMTDAVQAFDVGDRVKLVLVGEA